MGIFSLFNKKPEPAKSAARNATMRGTNSAERTKARKEAQSTSVPSRGTVHAEETMSKIDAIESEMSTEFLTSRVKKKSVTSAVPASVASKPEKRTGDHAQANNAATLKQPTLVASPTDLLLLAPNRLNTLASPSSESAAVIAESAIMYANGQDDVVEAMLREAIIEDMLGNVTQKAWWMLFDLYRVKSNSPAFEQLALEYAAKFETSPPGWESLHWAHAPTTPNSTSAPSVAFSGKIDHNTHKLAERIQKLASSHDALRLEFVRVTEVDVEGCRVLYDMLMSLQKSGHQLTLIGAQELADKISAILSVGRRDEGQECWLLLLEILRLLNHEQEYEEKSLDYCVTFEVSPPAFVPPSATVSAPTNEPSTTLPESAGLMLPSLIEGQIDNLILQIAKYSDEHDPAVIDCSQLVRIDFHAAGRLMTGLSPFCGGGKAIEFHNVNHLVAELFQIIGMNDLVRVMTRKS